MGGATRVARALAEDPAHSAFPVLTAPRAARAGREALTAETCFKDIRLQSTSSGCVTPRLAEQPDDEPGGPRL